MSISISLQTAGPPVHILNAYAPQSGAASHIKEAFYDQVESCLTTLPRAHPKYVLGDFKARIHAKLDHEHMFGPHIFGRGRKYLHFTSDEVAENRYMFLIFCASCDLKVMNTFFQKVPENQFTFREPATNHEPPWTPERFAQLDYVLAPESLKDGKKNKGCDCYSPYLFGFWPLHFGCGLLCLLQAKPKHVHKPKYRQPTPEQIAAFNIF